jgi:hypothetical protein
MAGSETVKRILANDLGLKSMPGDRSVTIWHRARVDRVEMGKDLLLTYQEKTNLHPVNRSRGRRYILVHPGPSTDIDVCSLAK